MESDVKMEFAVRMTCEKCVKAVEDSLQGHPGIISFKINLSNQQVLVNTSLTSTVVQKMIENSGRQAVLKGYGSDEMNHVGAAVSMLGDSTGSNTIHGVIRFLQRDNDTLIVDGTIDGLTPGLHGLHIHEYGDISGGCNSIGPHFNPRNTRHGSPEDDENERHAGDLGNITADNDGRASFRFIDRVLKIQDMIGRSCAVSLNPDDLGKKQDEQSKLTGNSGKSVACGIIARSAGLFQNPKVICPCDGVTIWDERDKPLTGPGRRTKL